MSFNVYWRPLPKDPPHPASGYQLKWAFAKRYGRHDGSCREEAVVLDEGALQWLAGVRDSDSSKDRVRAAEADRLMDCIKENPQGVRVWIGDPDDCP